MNATHRPLDETTRPFAAALLMADADDSGHLPPLNSRLLASLGDVAVGEVHAAWVAACVAAVEGWEDLRAENFRTVREADLLEAAQQATRWVQSAVTSENWLRKLQSRADRSD